MALISEKLAELKDEIAEICQKKGGDFAGVKIVAVTKNVDPERINESIKAGITDIGENRVQEAKTKFSSVRPCIKHFIGHLQRNKVKEAVSLFDTIDSVDSYPLAELINVESERAQKRMPVLVQINIAAETSKYGLSPDEVRHFVRKISILKYLEVQGLMAIMPFLGDPEAGRPHFRAMRELFESLKVDYGEFKRFSMGMSNDFRIAVEEGANEVRIGSYLFK
jgi:PLP dependent protein